jgi:signal transduction histidine kinase
MRGRISFELIFGVFLLSLTAITISFFVTIRLWEKKHIESEVFNLQKIFYDLKNNPVDLINTTFPLPSGTTIAIYNLKKELVKGINIWNTSKNIPIKLVIEYGKDFFYPSVLMYDVVPSKDQNYILVIRRDFDIEKKFLKDTIILFTPFALICLITLTGFSYIIYRKRILVPLKILQLSYQNIDNPSSMTKLNPVNIKEWDNLFSQFNKMMDRLKEYEYNLQKRIEELKEANIKIKNTQDEIIFSEKMATVGRLSAGLAHEIGNPLTSIIGYLSYLISDAKDENIKEILKIIMKETERINNIIRDLLNFARQEKKEYEYANPLEIIEETLKLLIPQKDFSKINIIKSFKAESLVFFSKESLKQVILNLLLNAIDVTPPQGTIFIKTYVENNYYCIEIEDEGGGIPDEIKDKIFEPFFTTKPSGKGTGLGLSVALTLVERYNGKLTFINRDKGASFIIKLKTMVEKNG